MKKIVLIFCIILGSIATGAQNLISENKIARSFPIVSNGTATTIFTEAKDHWLVQRAAALLQSDIEKVTGKQPLIIHTLPATIQNIIIIGSLDSSSLIREMAAQQKVKTDSIKGRWEAYGLEVINKPLNGVENALVIVGNDRRGTAYGVFDVTEQIGVSPWWWWADVPVKKKKELYFKGSKKDAPLVKYRGIFINDEAPALSGWSKEKFGGFNHKFYETVFELILRLKGNYLWPAMWGNAFNDDDSLNPVVAHNYGIVMGTSHHEPLVKAHDEWRRYGKGKWNYDSNAANLQAFWREGVKRMGTKENIISIGMRGDGDEPMTQGTAIALLERIVKDQRQIIKEVTSKDAAATPQLWALYKEVQDYYDKGMRVPDDVTLLLCDDNWGNIRKLPRPGDKKHAGGYGIYYHFDYVGGPRNYKWINTNQIERTWEQMNLAYEYGADKIWIVNVGDIKPMEFPITFFLDFAWNPNKWQAENLPQYYTHWATKQFGMQHAKAIGEIMVKYTKYNSRRKPELLAPETYSITNYNEWDRVVEEYKSVQAAAEKIAAALPPVYKDAYYQLVLHPVQASANLNELYLAVAKNKMYAASGNATANVWANKAKALYVKDSLITNYYNDTLAGGKWSHMMDQTHIGYTNWQQPTVNTMPPVTYVDGKTVVKQTENVPAQNKIYKTFSPLPKKGNRNIFYEKEGYVSIEAANYTTAVGTNGIQWKVIPNLGRTASAVTPLPVTAPAQTIGTYSPYISYAMYTSDTGVVTLHTYLSPTLPFHNTGLRYAVSIDGEQPQVVNMHEGYNEGIWNGWVANNIVAKTSKHKLLKPGVHTLKFWMIDPGVVVQKFVVDFGGLKRSYLGPPETSIK
jgi:hypothetical protein